MADKITWEDKQHILPYGTRVTQVQDLDMNEIKQVVNANADLLEGLEGGYQGVLLIADTPTEDGYYMAGESGTYTNAGGLVVDLTNTITFINVSDTQTTFTKTETLIPFNVDGVVESGNVDAVSGDTVYNVTKDKAETYKIQIIDNASNPTDYGITINEGAGGVVINWTGIILLSYSNDPSGSSNRYSHLIASSGTRTITLGGNDITTCYIKKSDFTGSTAEIIPVYYCRWGDDILKLDDTIILCTKNKSNYLKDVTGFFADFIRTQISNKELTDLNDRVTILESTEPVENTSSDVEALSLFDRGHSDKVYTSKKFGIITGGQSNTEGRVPLSTSPPSWYISEGSPTELTNVKHWNNNSEIWENWQMPALWAYDTIVYHALSNYLSDDIYVVKRALGGTAISELAGTSGASCWQPIFEKVEDISITKPKLTQQFEQYIREMKESAEYANIEIKAFLWHQGEGDYANPYNLDYYQNFKNLIAYVRGVLNNKTLPIIFGTISHSSAQYSSVVETAQLQIASEDDNAHVIDMSSGTLLDSYHFNGVSSEYLGNEMFNIIKDF